MAKHKKPSKEELQQVQDEALEEAKKVVPPTKEELLEKEVEEELAKEKMIPDEKMKEAKDLMDEEETTESEADVVAGKLKAEKKKSSASARENQKILAKNRTMTKALADAEDIPEPTQEELEKEYGKDEWDLMSNTEKKFGKEAVTSMRWRETIKSAKKQANKIDKWGEEVGDFVNDPQTLLDNPKLEGKTNDFVSFATKDEHNSVPINILVSAFLHENTSGKKSTKGKQFQKGSGGPNTKPIPTSNKISLEDARVLKSSDYDEYRKQMKAGNIETTV